MSCCCHAARRIGSLTGRFAFMAKAVWGRFRVDFRGLLSFMASVVCGFVSVTSGISSSGAGSGFGVAYGPKVYCIRVAFDVRGGGARKTGVTGETFLL